MYISILQEGLLTTVLSTPPVIRLVLLHKQGNRVILYFLKCISCLFWVSLGRPIELMRCERGSTKVDVLWRTSKRLVLADIDLSCFTYHFMPHWNYSVSTPKEVQSVKSILYTNIYVFSEKSFKYRDFGAGTSFKWKPW